MYTGDALVLLPCAQQDPTSWMVVQGTTGGHISNLVDMLLMVVGPSPFQGQMKHTTVLLIAQDYTNESGHLDHQFFLDPDPPIVRISLVFQQDFLMQSLHACTREELLAPKKWLP